MKKFCLFSVVACCIASMSVVFTGCKKDSDGGGGSTFTSITAEVEDGEDYNSVVDEVIAMMYYNDGEFEAAYGDYSKGGFTIEFPSEVANRYLSYVEFGDADMEPDDVRGGSVDFEAFDKSGNWLGDFQYRRSSRSIASMAYFVYVNKDCTVKGSYKERLGPDNENYSVSYDISLKKGWNKFYATQDADELTYSWTSKEPSGLKWQFVDKSNWSVSQPGRAIFKSSFSPSVLFQTNQIQ